MAYATMVTMVTMLINIATATGIAEGRITVVLRRWDAPRAKVGGTQRTPSGTIRIDGVREYPGDYSVTRAQARAAGFPDAKSAQAELDRRPAAYTYVIAVSYVAPDERHELAADTGLTEPEVTAITTRLHAWDAASSDGPWTVKYLELIAANETVRAPDLAATVGQETARFKRRVRRLKGLGLTISLDVGYRISPRGKAYLTLR
jgi:hypothetical protein